MKIGRPDPAPGFLLLVNMIVDQDTQEQVQITCNAPLKSNVPELAALLAIMRGAAWQERIAANDRIVARGQVISIARESRIAAARESGKTLDEGMLEEEAAAINAALIKVSAEAEADRAATRVGNGSLGL